MSFLLFLIIFFSSIYFFVKIISVLTALIKNASVSGMRLGMGFVAFKSLFLMYILTMETISKTNITKVCKYWIHVQEINTNRKLFVFDAHCYTFKTFRSRNSRISSSPLSDFSCFLLLFSVFQIFSQLKQCQQKLESLRAVCRILKGMFRNL